MLNLTDLHLFVEVIDKGGFSAAARHLGRPKSTISKRVAELEASLGARLVHRTSRSLALTDVGRDFFDHARAAPRARTEQSSAEFYAVVDWGQREDARRASRSHKHNILSYYALLSNGDTRRRYFGKDTRVVVLNVFSYLIAMLSAMRAQEELLGDRAKFMAYQSWEAFGDYFRPPAPRPSLTVLSREGTRTLLGLRAGVERMLFIRGEVEESGREISIDSPCGSAAEVSPGQTAIWAPAFKTHPVLAVAGHVALWHEHPDPAVPVPNGVSAVAGTLAEHALRVALVDLPVLVANASRPIAQQVRAGAQKPVVRLSRFREPGRPTRRPRFCPSVVASETIGGTDLPAAAKPVASNRRPIEKAPTVAGVSHPEVPLCAIPRREARVRPSWRSSGNGKLRRAASAADERRTHNEACYWETHFTAPVPGRASDLRVTLLGPACRQ